MNREKAMNYLQEAQSKLTYLVKDVSTKSKDRYKMQLDIDDINDDVINASKALKDQQNVMPQSFEDGIENYYHDDLDRIRTISDLLYKDDLAMTDDQSEFRNWLIGHNDSDQEILQRYQKSIDAVNNGYIVEKEED